MTKMIMLDRLQYLLITPVKIMKNHEHDKNDDDAPALEFVDYTGKQGLSDHTLGSTANNALGRSAITLYSALMIIFLSSGNNSLWSAGWTANNMLQSSAQSSRL